MSRQFAIVFFAMLLLATTIAGNLDAQGRGAFRFGAGGARNMPASSFGPRSTFGVNPHPVAPFLGGSRFGGLRHQRSIFGQPFIGGFSPFFWDAPFYTQPAYPAYAEPAYTTPSVSQNEIDLANEVQRLSQEIEQLRQEQALALSRQVQPPPPTPGPPPIPTTLVFRDGRRMMIENYAIVGQSIWVLDEKTSVKISMGELDVEATEKENRSKGVRFLMPQR